jgi:parallel beta-helix repeat protein
MKNTLFSTLAFCLFCGSFANVALAAKIEIPAENFEQKLNEALETAPAGSEIVMPEGHFKMMNELVIAKPGITLRGKGMEKTVLSFKNQKTGSQGVFGNTDYLTFEDFAIEDSAGNGLKVVQSNSPVFRRVKITWTSGPKEENGAYGLYPVMSRNVLIEDCDVSYASDAGVYVGQSENIIVRRNKVHGNVAGIEIENSKFADVYDNHTFANTAGVLIFNLPNLPVKGGRQTRVYNNLVEGNNLKNFSTEGGIVHLVPEGVGVLVMANSEVEIFNNQIKDNRFTGVAIAHYAISEKKYDDASYDPKPKHIYIHNNKISKRRFHWFAYNRFTIIIKLLAGLRTPEIVYDGIEDGTYEGSAGTDNDRLCIQNNTTFEGEAVTYGNLHLDNQRKGYPFPGGPATYDMGPHNCTFTPFPEVVLEARPNLEKTFQQFNSAMISPQLTEKFCGKKTEGVNWAAAEYDCPKLSDYRLFANVSDPTKDGLSGGFEYKLNNELFTDYAEKSRFIFLPPGQKIDYRASGVLDLPVGSVVTKTFSFYTEGSGGKTVPVETRLLIRRKSGWQASVYRWDNEKKEAHLFLGGEIRPMKILVHNERPMDIEYGIPNRRQCISCHATDLNKRNELSLIGPKAKFLNHNLNPLTAGKNQLVWMKETNRLKNLPVLSEVPMVAVWNDPLSGSLDKRAKAYLDINCAHCHSPMGAATNTGLFLATEVPTETVEYGRCKPPVAAGFGSGGYLYDVNPGHPETSILPFRMKSNLLAARMPQLGRSVEHTEAVALINDWVSHMSGDCR